MTAHKLLRLTEKLYNTPQLITLDTFNTVVDYLEKRNDGKVELAVQDTMKGRERYLDYDQSRKLGWISMEGPLTYIEYMGFCGPSGPSYQSMRDEADQLLEMGAKTLVLDQDSPGGEAYGAFETARHIREQADKYGAKIIAYVDGLSASASYVFSSVADEVIMNPHAEVGSIGVVVKLRNNSKAMKDAGVEDKYVYAGESKIPFDSEGNFSEGFLQEVQSKVDFLYGEFKDHVAGFRGIETSVVQATGAKTFMFEEAFKLGLADKKMTHDEFNEYLNEIAPAGDTMPTRLFKSDIKEKASMELEQLKTQLADLQVNFDAKDVELTKTLASLESLTAELTAAKDKIASLESAAVTAKLSARKEKLSAVMASDKVDAVAASLESLSDESFNTVLETFATQAKATKNTDLFNEQGINSDDLPPVDVQESTTALALKRKLNQA